MKAYPSIPGSYDRRLPMGEPCVGYYKYDGSNLRWEWNKKQGWYKFGTRHRLFGADEAPYNQAIEPFKDVIGPEVVKIVCSEYKGISDFMVFTEFFGPNSFAGTHVLEEPKKLVLLDVWVPRKSFILPKTFNKIFAGYEWTPEIVYQGNFNRELITDVRAGKYPVYEGMVCKGVDRRGQQWMAKVKTEKYLARLKERYGQDWSKYAE